MFDLRKISPSFQTRTISNENNSIVTDGLIVNLDLSNNLSMPQAGPLPVRYIRWYGNGSTSNPSTHFVELQALTSSGTNRALNAGTNGRVSQYTGGTPEFTVNNTNWQVLTNGNTDSGDYIGFASGGGGVQFDLGDVYTDISQIKFWNYYADGRTYYSVTIFVSSDGSNWTTLYGPTNTASNASGITVNNNAQSSTVFDLSGNNNNFTTFNTPSFNGRLMTFNGTNQYARSINNINLSAFNSVTVEIDLRIVNANVGMAFEHTADWNSNTGGFGLYPYSEGGAYVLNRHHTNHNSVGAMNYSATVGSDFATHTNIFSRISDASGRQTYVNGVSVASQSTGAGFFANALMYIGSRGGASAFGNHQIGGFRVYSRKLSASEVFQNFMAVRRKYSI